MRQRWDNACVLVFDYNILLTVSLALDHGTTSQKDKEETITHYENVFSWKDKAVKTQVVKKTELPLKPPSFWQEAAGIPHFTI